MPEPRVHEGAVAAAQVHVHPRHLSQRRRPSRAQIIVKVSRVRTGPHERWTHWIVDLAQRHKRGQDLLAAASEGEVVRGGRLLLARRRVAMCRLHPGARFSYNARELTERRVAAQALSNHGSQARVAELAKELNDGGRQIELDVVPEERLADLAEQRRALVQRKRERATERCERLRAACHRSWTRHELGQHEHAVALETGAGLL